MKNATLTADGTEAWEALQYGHGYLLIDASSGSGFGSGTLTLEMKRTSNGAAVTVTSYTSTPSPNPVRLDFGAPVAVRVKLAGATAPTLYYEIGDQRTP